MPRFAYDKQHDLREQASRGYHHLDCPTEPIRPLHHTRENLKQIAIKRKTMHEEIIKAIMEAYNVPGPVPAYHAAIIQRMRHAFPVMSSCLHLLANTEDDDGAIRFALLVDINQKWNRMRKDERKVWEIEWPTMANAIKSSIPV